MTGIVERAGPMSETSRGGHRALAGLGLTWLAALLLVLPQVIWWQVADPDLWGRISVGAVLSQAGHLPAVDDFQIFGLSPAE